MLMKRSLCRKHDDKCKRSEHRTFKCEQSKWLHVYLILAFSTDSYPPREKNMRAYFKHNVISLSGSYKAKMYWFPLWSVFSATVVDCIAQTWAWPDGTQYLRKIWLRGKSSLHIHINNMGRSHPGMYLIFVLIRTGFCIHIKGKEYIERVEICY